MADKVRSEDVLGKKWDRCLSDTAIKTVSGIGVGIVFSVVFCRTVFYCIIPLQTYLYDSSPESPVSVEEPGPDSRQGRPWPVIFGSGIGLGMAFSNCENDFMTPNLFHGTVRKIEGKDGSPQ